MFRSRFTKTAVSMLAATLYSTLLVVGCGDDSNPANDGIIEIACREYNPTTHFCDTRDGKTYRMVRIGTQTWMAENLNYETSSGSRCYDNDPTNCSIYGRLYDWGTTMAGTSGSSANPSGVRGICPRGWHLPSNDEWETLVDFVGGWETAGTKLKSSTGWVDRYGDSANGTDEYGFSALPGGDFWCVTGFGGIGVAGNWWTSEETFNLPFWSISSGPGAGHMTTSMYNLCNEFSVRCVRD